MNTFIQPIPALAELREAVLLRSEKRKPKWGFRLAGNLVLELQPKPVSLLPAAALAKGCRQMILHFEAQAVMTEGADKAALEKLPRDRPPYRKRTFSLSEFEDDRGRWLLAFLCGLRSHGSGQSGTDHLDGRILAAFQDGFFECLTPTATLRPACMICGKGLTAASMARWIGPECASTSSVRIFWTERLPLEAAE